MNLDFFEKGHEYFRRHFINLNAAKLQILKNPTVNSIHQARTNSRRLKSSLLFYKKFIKKIRYNEYNKLVTAILKRSGKIRDLDVLIFFLKKTFGSEIPVNVKPAVERLLLRMLQLRDKLMPDLVTELEKYNFEKYASGIEKIFSRSNPDDLKSKSGAKQISKKKLIKFIDKCNNTTNSYYSLLIDEKNIKELHDYRKEVKKQRYTLEFFNTQFRFNLGKEITKLKSYQETLGFIHDADVWQILLDDFIIQENKRIKKYYGNTAHMKELLPGIYYLKTNLEKRRGADYDKFVKEFQEDLGKDFWVNMYNGIIQP
jgi:CHAD domain-containing protein